ncbi:hypothetical protein [Mycobacterium sp.]|uniref:hypothetical protein n=1 Tax=Mycobacterium sp. TaxID=1785 RepID=UPI0031D54230
MAGVAATVATGAVAMVTMLPQVAGAGPVLSNAFRLLSTDSLQPLIDQLLEAQAQIQADVSQYPFVTPPDLLMAHEYAQNALQTMEAGQILQFNYDQLNNVAIPLAPYPWEASATDNQNLLVYENPDDQYTALPLSPDHTYTMTITPPAGPSGTSDVTFTFVPGTGVTTPFGSAISSYNLSEATPNPNGTYTLIFSSTPQQGNWVGIPTDAERTIVRDSVGNWGLPHDSFAITEQGVPAPSPLHPPLLTTADIESILSPVAQNAANEVASPDYYGQIDTTNTYVPVNDLSPIQPTSDYMPGPLLNDGNQLLSSGQYSLQPDQALVIKVPEVNGAYASAMVTNIYGQTAPSATATGSLNAGDTFHDPGGYTYYVVSSQDPGVANWLNDNGAADGGIWLRFQGTSHIPTTPIPVTSEVVPVADVKQYLPADTPTVTPAQYAADAQLRLFEWDYTHDQNENIGWLGSNLEYDQIKAALGPQTYADIFGGQSTQYGAPQFVPSVLDRLIDPSLTPNLFTIIHDIVADPHGAFLALQDNLSLAVNDIEMPTILALLRTLVVVEGTGQALKSAVSAHDWSQVLTDVVKGIGGLGSVANETLTDPGTSITAGFLNARDDLAVSIMNASSYSATSPGSASFADSLLSLAQSVSQALNPSTALADFNTLSAEITAQFASQGADVAPSFAAMPLDLLPLP